MIWLFVTELFLNDDCVFRALLNAGHTDQASVGVRGDGYFFVVLFPFLEYFHRADFYARPISIAFFIVHCYFGHVAHPVRAASCAVFRVFPSRISGCARVRSIDLRDLCRYFAAICLQSSVRRGEVLVDPVEVGWVFQNLVTCLLGSVKVAPRCEESLTRTLVQ